MKREINFRIYDPNTKSMTYCDYGIEYKNAIFFTGSEYIEGGAAPYPVEYAKDCLLMQFTGLHDKNGREIWEGDICKDIENYRFPIEWDDDLGGFIWDNYSFISMDIEIIGNIHENPELL